MPPMPALVALLLASGLSWAARAAGVPEVRKAFTVVDSIEWTSIVNFGEDYDANPANGTALFSPSGRQFLLHTVKAHPQENAVVDRLLLFDTAQVRDYLSAASSIAPTPRVLVALIVDRESGRMANVRWLSEEEVAFLGQGDNGISQAFLANIRTGATSQLTRSPTAVVSFAAAADKVLYYAYEESPPRPTIAAVDRKTLGEIIFPRVPEAAPLAFFSASRAGGAAQRIDSHAMNLFGPFQGIWPSPSGRYAIVFIPATNAPAHWVEYQVSDYDRFAYTRQNVVSDPASEDVLFRTRYALAEPGLPDVKPLLDAPSGWLAQNYTPERVYWLSEQKLIVTNAYLPLANMQGAERARRRAQPAVAEVDLRTGRITPIFWEPILSDGDRKAGKRFAFILSEVQWDAGRSQLTLTKRRRDLKTRELHYEQIAFQRRGKTWRRVDLAAATAAPTLSVNLRQSLNERPKVLASQGELSKVLFDPDPQAESLTFGNVEVIAWKDNENDIDWKGGLVYPVGYAAGRRYPLIVQSHGFDPQQFLLDGPAAPTGGSTAMAAQALANSGFVVLQMEDNALAFTGDEHEGPRSSAGAKAGIDYLVHRGLADPANVGFIGFSRTGFHALYLLARYPGLVRAANISDSVQANYLESHVLMANGAQDSLFEINRMVGVEPGMKGVGKLFATHPLYQLENTTAAVRLEANDIHSVLGLWETYAVLKNSHRAVDMICFTDGSHVQFRPAERLESQGGNVDWFRFWLQGYEDPVVTKQEKYIRWRAMKRGVNAPH